MMSQLKVILWTLTLVLGLVNSTNLVPSPTFKVPPPPGETYITGFPICNTSGYTVVPSYYTETVHQQRGATLHSCYNECRKNRKTCRSLAFHARYTLCLWFDRIVQDTQLYDDGTSEFVHWDLECHVK